MKTVKGVVEDNANHELIPNESVFLKFSKTELLFYNHTENISSKFYS